MNKKHIFIYMLIALPMMLLTSCLKDQDDTFDKSASARMTTYLNQVADVLKSSDEGWVLNYYPDREQSYGSLIFTLKFDGENVEAACPDLTESFITVESKYKLVADDGPVLTFDTYNELLHYCATPDEDNYEALDGDFEFIVISISEDKNTITLKGKRSGNMMKMQRLTYDAEEYFAAVSAIREEASAYSVLQASLSEGNTVKFAFGDTFFSASYKDEDGKKVSKSLPYHATDNGVIFYAPFEAYGKAISGLSYNTETHKITLADDVNIVLGPSTDVIDQLVYGEWYLDYENCSDAVKDGLDVFNAGAAGLGGLSYSFLGSYSSYGFGYWAIVGRRYIGGEILDFEEVGDDTITISPTGTYQANGAYFNTNCNMGAATEPFYGTFKLSKDDVENPTYIIMTDVNDPKNVTKLVAE